MQQKVSFRRVARHRARSRLLAASALLTTGVAAFLSPATGVAQADAMNWDAVAQCESGGNWQANTGNGFYGGLQFKEPTWRQFGGVGSPATASREEQIAVANRVLAVQGPDAWPTCGAETLWAPQWQSSVRPVIKMIWGLIPH